MIGVPDDTFKEARVKPTVYIDLSGWPPKYFSPTLVQYANTLLKHKEVCPQQW